ncbi:hypothetical protein [Microbacterium sp. NPDC056569]|uniref:hypothetical protein n=1 Tax=Microbacterium sp. NPDC056569 TaxID=3345867 RepID=UPI00366E5C90
MPETLIAVAGSLIGVVIGSMFTYTFTKHAQVSKSLHDARIAAYAEFAAAVMDYRRALMERWFVRDGAAATAGDEPDVYAARSHAWGTYFKVQLLAGDDTVRTAARTALDRTGAIKDAPNRAGLVTLSDQSRGDVEAFVSTSRDDVAAHARVL